MKEFNFDKFEQEAIQHLKDGQGLLGKEGVLTPLLKRFLEKALEGELDHHLGEEKRNKGNRRNGRSRRDAVVRSSRLAAAQWNYGLLVIVRVVLSLRL